MSTYLSAPELADLIGCRPNSFACMRRWLDKNGWPYVPNRIGMPMVSKAFHDARMSGQAPRVGEPGIEPDFSMFD